MLLLFLDLIVDWGKNAGRTEKNQGIDHISIFSYNIAVKCAELGMTVVAGCYDVKSAGALQLIDLFKDTNRVYIVPLDVTKSESVSSIYSFVKELLQKDPELGKISL